MSIRKRMIVLFFKVLTSVLCRIDDEQLRKVPPHGPLILVINHINLVEIPVLYTRLQPRPLSGFVAAYRWENPFLRWLLSSLDAIPLRRGTADVSAMRRALDRLQQGSILAVAPEGTRSGHGRLQRGHAGVVMLALQSGAPLQPVAFYGNERFNHNLRRLRRTDFHLTVGEAFHLDPRGERVTRQVRQEMIEAVMYKLAALLPAQYRGVYADLNRTSEQYVRPAS